MGFNGLVEVGYQEVESYLRCRQAWFPHWYATLLFKLSTAYVVQASKSKEPTCSAPYTVDGFDSQQSMREAADKKLRGFFNF